MIPQEAGLNERAVSFTKGCYVGQETVARLYYRGKPNRQLRGLRLSAPAATGDRDHASRDRVVGRLASVAAVAALGPIALALVRREAPAGSAVTVGADAARARPSSSCRSSAEPAHAAQRVASVGGRRSQRQLRRVGMRASHVARIRTSSISAGGTCAPSSPVRPARIIAAAVRLSSCAESRRPAAAPSRRAGRRRARTRRSAVSVGCGAEQQPRARVGRLEHARRAARGSTPRRCAAPAQRAGALVAPLGGGGAHLARRRGRAAAARAAAGARDEQPQHLVEPPPVEVGVEVAQARRQAAPHLPVRRRVLTARQPPPAVAQPEQRVELLDQLERQPPAPQRTDRDRVAGRRVGATSRIGNGMSSRQRM